MSASRRSCSFTASAARTPIGTIRSRICRHGIRPSPSICAGMGQVPGPGGRNARSNVMSADVARGDAMRMALPSGGVGWSQHGMPGCRRSLGPRYRARAHARRHPRRRQPVRRRHGTRDAGAFRPRRTATRHSPPGCSKTCSRLRSEKAQWPHPSWTVPRCCRGRSAEKMLTDMVPPLRCSDTLLGLLAGLGVPVMAVTSDVQQREARADEHASWARAVPLPPRCCGAPFRRSAWKSSRIPGISRNSMKARGRMRRSMVS